MPLESLLTLVGKLRERIDAHGPALRQSETLTRYTLIDPLLRELGWDTENPDLVIPEYKTDDGRPDYALLSNGKPIMMVEAKKLGTLLQDRVLAQGLTYANGQGTKYFSVSDGARWEIYETFKPVRTAEKRIVEFDLKSGSAAETCLKALTLWELRESGHVAPGQTPIVEPSHNQPDSQEPPTPQPTRPSPDGWQLLSKLNPQRGARSPVEIQFPDNSGVSVTTWRSLLAKVATWLIDNNHLTKSHCPIRKTTRSKKYIVHTEPVHEDGSKFYTPTPHQIGLLYVHRFTAPVANTNACRTIIEHVGQDPAHFRVRFSPLRN